MTLPPSPPSPNTLLASLSEGDRCRLHEQGSLVACSQLDVLQRAEEPIRAVHFPESGWVSMMAALECGRTSQVGMVGREGMVGLELLLGSRSASFEWVVQGPCNLLRVDACDFRELLRDSATLKASLIRFVASFHDQVAQTAACNANHTVEQRLARLLLMAHDRSLTGKLPLTQELLSAMLGVRRASVSTSINLLKTLGCVDHDRGVVTIKERTALEAATCECYRVSRRRECTRS